MGNPIKKVINVIRQWQVLRKMPLRLEFVVTDYCNLNCKGCTHYSPLATKEFESLDRLDASMSHLGKVCRGDVDSVYLIGGETLLYPQLVEAMVAMRRHFPQPVKAYIFTNGIALKSMSDEFWQTARDLGFIIAITRYPIKIDYDAIIADCKAKGVTTEVFGDRSMADSFFRFGLDPTKSQNARIAHFKCYNRGCVSIIGNRLYPCSISACVSHLNKACGTHFEHVDGDWLDINSITSAKDILHLRNNPVPFCRYCINPPTTVAYGPSKRDVSEWVDNR